MLDLLCSVKKENFDEIFDDFFLVRKIKQDEIMKRLDNRKIYKSFELKKVEIKNKLSYNIFIENFLKKLNEFYYDGNKKQDKDEIDLNEAKWQLNQYYPKNGMLLDDFLVEKFEWIIWKNCIKEDKNRYKIKNNLDDKIKAKIINVLQTKNIELENIIPKKHYVCIIKWKIDIKTSEQILWHLHWDIWEFILFFLTEALLWKPILFSKIQHTKWARWDKVKWSDWIHIDYKDWKPSFIFLEAKMKKDFHDCITEVISSHWTFLQEHWDANIDNEINILFANRYTIDALWFTTIFQNGFEKYINPYRRKEISKDEFPFSLVSCIMYENNSSYNEELTIWRIQKTLEKYKTIENLLKNRKVSIFLFPMINQTELLKNFLEQIWYEKQ